MRGVFEIERRDFYMTSDANFDPRNDFNIKFETVKATCQLEVVNRDSRFGFSVTDYANVIKNIRALENLAPKQKGEIERLSVVTGSTNVASSLNCTIKLSHGLFTVNTLTLPLNCLLIYIHEAKTRCRSRKRKS